MSDPKTLDAAALDDIDRRVHYLTGGIFIDVSIAEMESLLAMARRTLALEEATRDAQVALLHCQQFLAHADIQDPSPLQERITGTLMTLWNARQETDHD